MKVWVLTREENEYDQYGEYFCGVFANKPTKEQLVEAGVTDNIHVLNWVLSVGGREEWEHTWWYLREEEAK